MNKEVIDLYYHIIRGKRWVEKNKNSAIYQKGVERLAELVDQITDLGFPDYPFLITADSNDRFGFPNKKYLASLPTGDANLYTKFKFEEISVLVDEGFFRN